MAGETRDSSSDALTPLETSPISPVDDDGTITPSKQETKATPGNGIRHDKGKPGKVGPAKSVNFKAGDLVWAKAPSYPYFPAEIVDHVADRSDIMDEIFDIQPSSEDDAEKGQSWLVRFFDSGNTYAWARANKLDVLGQDNGIDAMYLAGKDRKSSRGFKTAHMRRNCQEAYRRALSEQDEEEDE